MHKKLYKAKKNWVIGLVAGSILMFGCVAGANADDQVNVSQPDTNTSALSQMTEQATDPNNQVVSSDHTNNQVEVIKNQNNTVNNSQPVITMQDEYLNKATIFERDSDLYTFGYGDISPDNIAVPIQNGKNIDFKNDDDSSPMISWYRGHYNSHINAHQTLFSKNIIRRGQQYTVGVASANDNVTFLPYIQNENNMVVGDGAGISESPYSLAGQYFGPSFQGGANIEWNNYQAHAFGVAEYNDNDVFSELPKAYHDSSTIETNLFVTMQDNGVINYKTLWKNYSKNSNDIGFLRDSTYPEEQPFAFEFGNIRFKTDDKYIRMSPIWQITNTLYFNYGLVDKYTDNPQYILQFIKTNGSETKVMSEIKNPILDLYSSEEENKNIPGLAQFVPENAKTFNRGIVIYSPVTETNMTNIHNGLGTIAFGKNNREHTINFQRVFMNSKELSGLTSEEILPYVYGLFNDNNGNSNNGNSNSQVTQKVQLIFRDIATHKPVLSKEVLCKTPYLNFGINGLDLSKTLLYLGEDGKIYLNDKKHNLLFRVVNPSQYKKISITSPKLQDILVEPVVDLDKEDTDFVLTETGLDVATFNDIKDFAKKTAKAFNLFNQGKKVKDAVDKDSDKKWYGLDGEEDEMQSEARKKDQSSGIKVISVLGKSNKLFVDANTTNSDVKDKNILKYINDWSNNLNDVKNLGLELIKDLDVLTKPLTSLATRLNGKSRNKIYNRVSRWTSISDSKGFKLFSQFNEKADPVITVGLGSMDLFQSISTAEKDMGNDKHVSQQSPSNRVKEFKKVRKDGLTFTEKAVTLIGGIISLVAAATGVGIPLATAITAVLSVGGAAILAVLLWRLLSAISTSKYTDKKLLAKFKVSKKK